MKPLIVQQFKSDFAKKMQERYSLKETEADFISQAFDQGAIEYCQSVSPKELERVLAKKKLPKKLEYSGQIFLLFALIETSKANKIFAIIYYRERTKLLDYLIFFLKVDRFSAEELVHDILMVFWGNLKHKNLKLSVKVTTYLRGIGRNKVKRYQTNKNKNPEMSIDCSSPPNGANPNSCVYNTPYPDDTPEEIFFKKTFRREMRGKMARILRTLSKRHQQVYFHRIVRGLPYREIALKLGYKNAGVVRNIVSKLLKKYREERCLYRSNNF